MTAAFYLFVELPDCAALQAPLLARCEALEIKGLILLAHEGINGTVAGAPENIAALLGFLRADPRLRNLEHKESWSEKPPFRRMRVRVKREIVTLGVPGINPAKQAGIYVKPQHWNALISRPDVIVVDTRNTYEVELGTFQRAKNPQIASFSELPRWIESAPSMQPERGKRPVVAMFCTGGIRCEKSTALLRQQGFTEVYHLQGGILKYLEVVPPEDSLWQGECFVFDERVSVGHGLQAGPHQLCRCCRQPLPEGALDSPEFELGVSCPRCYASTSPAQKDGARERQRQWERAKKLAQAQHAQRVDEDGPDEP
ncbi:MAG: rhodanese-related sulfurtransferase [Betaproteobacteria bacterium]|nr:rhodanese-related sulfurtransferase [Betaproteobacteria bacterium]